MDYKTADAKLTGRCARRRKLENNTYLERRDGRAIAVRLHSTDVLTFFPNGSVKISTGGWKTVTTRARINSYLSGWAVYSYRDRLVLCRRPSSFKSGWELDDSATISARGKVSGFKQTFEKLLAEIRIEDNARNRIRNRARYWVSKARGIFRNAEKCTKPGRGWHGCQCHGRDWGRRPERQELGTCEDCGCVFYHKQASAKGLTVQNIMAEENVSVRVAKVQIYGLERFLLDSNAKVISEDSGYQLLDLPLEANAQTNTQAWNAARIRALKMTCPSTGAVYISPVDPNCDTVRKALDWAYQTENYLDNVGTQT